jgi:hypothetical protein
MARPKLLELGRWIDPLTAVELFIVANLGFLALDIYIAHSINQFADPAEWVPLVFSAVSPFLLLAAMALGGSVAPPLAGAVGRRAWARALGMAVGWGSVAVGVAGLLLHLESQFFRNQTLKNLVYTAPFAAPLAYAGLGLLILLNRMVKAETVEWARWVVLLALGGFVGNFVLALADHAQNGFFHPAEWIGVGSAALGVGALLAVLLIPDNRPLLWFCAAVMGLQTIVGVLGFAYHGLGNLKSPMGSLWEQFLYGAPIFAPLLFANIAALAVLGLWALARTEASPQRFAPMVSMETGAH